MKTLRLLFCAVLLMAVMSSVALANDYAHFHFIGFSNGGKYLAFEEYGINDDVDDKSPYSAIYIVNVDENSFAIPPFKLNLEVYDERDWDESETVVRAKNRRRAKKQLKRFGIIDGNTGLQVVAHLVNEYDFDDEEPVSPSPTPTPEEADNANFSSPNANSNMSFNANTAGVNTNSNSNPKEVEKIDPMDSYYAGLLQQVSFTKARNTLWRNGSYRIEIKPVPVKQHCDQYESERDIFSFEMTLTNEAKETKILQKSGKVPLTRGCVDGYGIQEAFLYHNKLAVFVGIFTRGWEGENLRLMAVTGELDN